MLLAAGLGLALSGKNSKEQGPKGPDAPKAEAPKAPTFPPIFISPPAPPPKPGEPVTPLAMTKAPAKFADDWTWTLETTQARKGVLSLAYQPQGHLVAVGSEEGTIRLYEARTGKFQKAILWRGPVKYLTWTPDGKQLVVTQVGGLSSTAIFNLESGSIARELDKSLYFPRVSPDGKWLAGGQIGIDVYDLTRTGKPLELKLPNTFPAVVAWHPKSTQLMVGYQDGQVRVWGLTKQQPEVVREFESGLKEISGMAWKTDENYAVGGAGYLVRLGAKKIAPLGEAWADTIEWSPDGNILAVTSIPFGASGTSQASIKLVNLTKDDGRAKHLCVGAGATWARDGKELAVVAAQSEVQFINLNGKVLREIKKFDQELKYNTQKGYFIPPAKDKNPFVFVVQSKEGQKTYTPEEFEKLTGGKWKNDPDSLK